MRIYLRDHDEDKSGWTDALARAFGKNCFAGTDTEDIHDEEGAGSIVFLHTQRTETRDAWTDDVRKGEIEILILINSGGRSDLSAAAEKVFPCHWDPSEFGSEARPKELIEQIKGRALDKVDWALLQPERREVAEALHVLCEAYLLESLTQGAQYCPEVNVALGVRESWEMPAGLELHVSRARNEWLRILGLDQFEIVARMPFGSQEAVRSFFDKSGEIGAEEIEELYLALHESLEELTP